MYYYYCYLTYLQALIYKTHYIHKYNYLLNNKYIRDYRKLTKRNKYIYNNTINKYNILYKRPLVQS